MDEDLTHWLEEAFAGHARFRAVLAAPSRDVKLLDASFERATRPSHPATREHATTPDETTPRARDH